MGSPDDLMRMLRKMSGKSMDDVNDPSKFDRAVEITDPYVLGWIAERDVKTNEGQVLYEQLQLLISEIEVFKKKIFLKLKSVSPNVETGEGKTGFRKWQGKYYYVGWDDK